MLPLRRKFLAGAFALALLFPGSSTALSSSARRRLLRQVVRAIAGVYTQGFPQSWEQLMRMLSDEIQTQREQQADKEIQAFAMAGDAVVRSVIDAHNHAVLLASRDITSSCSHAIRGFRTAQRAEQVPAGEQLGPDLVARMAIALAGNTHTVPLASTLQDLLSTDQLSADALRHVRLLLKLSFPTQNAMHGPASTASKAQTLGQAELMAKHAAAEAAIEQLLVRRTNSGGHGSPLALFRASDSDMASRPWRNSLRDQPSETVLARELARIRAFRQALDLEVSSTMEAVSLLRSVAQSTTLEPVRSRI